MLAASSRAPPSDPSRRTIVAARTSPAAPARQSRTLPVARTPLQLRQRTAQHAKQRLRHPPLLRRILRRRQALHLLDRLAAHPRDRETPHELLQTCRVIFFHIKLQPVACESPTRHSPSTSSPDESAPANASRSSAISSGASIVARPAPQSAKVAPLYPLGMPISRQAAPDPAECPSARFAKAASNPHRSPLPAPAPAAAAPCRRDTHHPTPARAAAPTPPTGSAAAASPSTAARNPPGFHRDAATPSAAPHPAPHRCLPAASASAAPPRDTSAPHPPPALCPPPPPESTGSDRAISPHTESIVRNLSLRGCSSSPQPSSASRRNTASANLRVSRSNVASRFSAHPRSSLQLRQHALPHLLRRLHGKRDRQHLLRLVHALIRQQLQIALNQQPRLARPRRRLDDPRVPDIERLLPLLPIRRRDPSLVYRYFRNDETDQLTRSPSGEPPSPLRPSPQATTHPAGTAISARSAHTSSDSSSAAPAHRPRQTPPPAPSAPASTRSTCASNVAASFNFSGLQATRLRPRQIPSTRSPYLHAPAQTPRPAADRPPTKSHTAEAAARPASPSANRSARCARLVINQHLATFDLIDPVHPHIQPQRPTCTSFELSSRSASLQTASRSNSSSSHAAAVCAAAPAAPQVGCVPRRRARTPRLLQRFVDAPLQHLLALFRRHRPQRILRPHLVPEQLQHIMHHGAALPRIHPRPTDSNSVDPQPLSANARNPQAACNSRTAHLHESRRSGSACTRRNVLDLFQSQPPRALRRPATPQPSSLPAQALPAQAKASACPPQTPSHS